MSRTFNEVRRTIVPERVQTDFKLDPEGADPAQTLPFVMTLLAHLSGHGDAGPLGERTLVGVNKESLPALFKRYAPELVLYVKNRIDGTEDLKTELKFRDMKDFSVEALIEMVPYLRSLMEKRRKLVKLRNAVQSDPDGKKALASELSESVQRGLDSN